MLNILLAILLALLPWGARWIVRVGLFEYGTLSLYAIDVLIGLLFLYALRRGIVRVGIKKLGYSALALGLLLAFAVASQQWALDRTVARLWSFHLALGIGLCLTIASETKRSHWPLYGFLTGALIQSFLASWQFITQKVVASTLLGVAAQNPETLGVPVIEAYGGRILRAFGTFPHPNILGGYLALAGVLALVALTREDRPRHARWLEFCFLFIQPGLAFSFSRSAWLAFAVGIIALLATLINPSIKRLFPILTISIALVAISFFQFPDLFRARLVENRLNTISTNERAQYARDGNGLIRAHPILGVGAGNFSIAVQKTDPSRPAHAYQPVHDVFALATSELGTIGLALIILIFAIMLYSMIALPAGLALLVIAASDHYLWSLPIGMYLFWTVFAFIKKEPGESHSL